MSEVFIPVIEPGTDTLTAALKYAAAGGYIVPVRVGKHPGSRLGKGWPEKSSRDPEVLVSWFAGRGAEDGIALHLGRSGLLAFDVDRPQAVPAELAAFLTSDVPHQSTRPDQPGRGHWLFRQPEGRSIGNSTGRLGASWGEVRGRNGVIVLAPTRHPSGGLYRWITTGTVPALPAALADALPDSSSQGGSATDEEVLAFVRQHRAGARPGLLGAVVDRWHRRYAEGVSRHVAATEVTCWAFREARAGFYPAQLALDELATLFLTAMETARTPMHPGDGPERILTAPEAASEWSGIVAWAVNEAMAADVKAVRRRVNMAGVRQLLGAHDS